MADNTSEILALLAESMRAADRDREENMRRFERFAEIIVEGLGRLEDRLGTCSDKIATSLNHTADEITELKTDVSAVSERFRNATGFNSHSRYNTPSRQDFENDN